MNAGALKSTLFIPQISCENSVFLLTEMLKMTPLRLAPSFEIRLTFMCAEQSRVNNMVQRDNFVNKPTLKSIICTGLCEIPSMGFKTSPH